MLKLSRQLKLGDEAVTYKMGLVGRTGTGKTNTATVLAEQMIAGGFPCVILDPQGDWWGLRSTYKIAILGGEHADVPLEPTGGKVAADFVVNERVPVLLDLFSMGEGEMVRFAADFAERLWAKNREAVHVFVDEADLFAPQSRAKGPKAVCLGHWQNIVRRGRSRGIGCTMITQRTAVLNKDLLTQADPLFVHRLTAPQDLEAIKAYLEYHGGDSKAVKATLAQVSRLKIGQALVISPGTLEIEPQLIDVYKRKSFDSSATPEPGKSISQPKSFAEVNLDALKTAMSDTIERAKADDPKELRRRIRELEKELAAKPSTEVDQGAIERAVAAAVAEPKRVASVLDRKIDSFVGILNAIANSANDALSEHGNLSQRSKELDSLLNEEDIAKVAGEKPRAVKVEQFGSRKSNLAQSARKQQENKPRRLDQFRPASAATSPAVSSSLPKGEAAVLTACIQFPDGLERNQLTVLTGYKRSSRDAYIQRLREKGLVETDSGTVVATDEGFATLPNAEPLPTGAELQGYWLARLPEGERRILEALIEAYPDELQRDELSDLTGYKRSSRDAYVQRMRAKQLIEEPSRGCVRASENLF